MTNHSKADCIRFHWPDLAWLKFSPQIGHLHPGNSKDFTVTFKADQPRLGTGRSDLSKEKSDKTEQAKVDQAKPAPSAETQVLCKVTRIVFDKPIAQVCFYDFILIFGCFDKIHSIDKTVSTIQIGGQS